MKIPRLVLILVLAALDCHSQSYQVTDLGALTGTNSYAQGINNQRQVVGYWDTTNGTHAFLYGGGAITDLGTLGGLNSYAMDINSAGQIVGFSQTPEGVGAFLYGDGAMTNLGTLGGLNSYGFGINDVADIVGSIQTTNGFQAILLSNGEVTELGTLGGTNSFAYSVNLLRQVAGTSLIADNTSPNAFLWQDNLLTNLNDLLPLGSGWQLQEARAINNAGQIVGWGLLNSVKHAFLFSSNTIIDLGVLPGGTNSYALGMNNSNQVVGASTISNGILHGFLWDNGILKDLNNSLPTNSGWELREATAINDQGQIAGWGTNQGSESAFLMVPSPLPSSSSLQLWFRADVGVITDGNGNVSQWLDQSGNGNHASQTVMAAEPVLATNAINGEPVVRFNGTSDCLSFPAVNTTNFTVFIVYRMTGHQAWAGPLENRAAGQYGFEVASGSADTSVYEPELVVSLGSQELADETTGVGTSLPLGPVLQEWTSDERFFQDGLEQTVVNGATGWDVSGGRLGYAWSYMDGDIAEVLIYNTVLSDTDRQGVENYLNGKYAVLSAPPAPVISPPGGTYPGSVTVTLSTPTLGTELYYTTDGSQPTTNSTLYAGSFNLSSNATVMAVSYLNGMASATTNADFAVTAGSTPTTATGLAFWFRADVGVIADGSGNVSQWLDQSGNGIHASQTAAAAEPVLATNAINGEPAVRFNGTSDYLSFPAVNTTNFTIFIVYRMSGHQAWSGPLENRTAGQYGFEMASGSADTSVYEPELVESFGSQELADKTTGVNLSLPLGPTLQEWTSSARFFQDGLEQAVVNGATGWDVSGGRLGYAWSYMAGDIAEVLVYNTVLSDTDRQGVESYLNGKYAVLSTPPAPVISPAGGTYPGSVTVTLSTPALGTQLYYTTDGNQPTTNSTLYAGPFNLSSNATVTAVSYLNGMESATTNADFLVTAGSAPTTVTGLAFWFRADEGVITDTNGDVSQWLDESGNGNHASQTVMAAEPVLATNAINGEPVVRFNGTSDYLSFPAVNTTNFTVFIVYRMTGHQAWGGPLENRAAGLNGFEVASGSADTSVYEPELVVSLGSQELADKTTGVNLSLPLGPTLQEWTSGARFFQDGLEQTVVNGATGWDVSGGRLGYAWSYMAGDIAEVLVYNTVLSDMDRQGVENYLNGKYAVLTPPPEPVISPVGGTYPGSVTVTLSTPTLGTELYYTTDGSQPTTNSTLYTGAFNLSSNATVTAVSYLNGMASATTNADFLVTAGSAPTTATGLAFWFRADVGVITDGNGNVSQWLDESGNGNHARQTATAAEPVLATNAINGEPVVRFNGTSDSLSFPAVNTTNFTVFIVYRMTGHQAWGGPLENRAAGQYGFEVASGSADTSVYEPQLVESFGTHELTNKTTGVGLSLPLGPTLQEWTSDARFFQDGLEQTVVNGVSGWDVSGGRLGYAWSYMAGDIAEVLVYDTVLSDMDRQGVETYLNGKYFNPANTNDYYNGNLPNITITSGNNQTGLTNSWLPIPLTVQLTDTNGLVLTDAPLTFTVIQGSALIANSTNGPATNSMQITTDTNGQAAVWLQLPSSIGTNIVTVSAQSGTNVAQVAFTEIAAITGDPGLLGSWQFDTTNWLGDQGQEPVMAANLELVPSWSSNAMELNSNDGYLIYNLVESNGHTNLSLQCGTIRLWFCPNWGSADQGGPEYDSADAPTLFEVDDANSGGYWSAYINAGGESIEFDAFDGNSLNATLQSAISWKSNQWHQVAITYTPTNFVMYVDGSPVAYSGGITYIPDSTTFYVGNDIYALPAYGRFDVMDTFDYPLSAQQIATNYQAAINLDTDGSGLPNIWQMDTFGHLGVDTNATNSSGDGFTYLEDYEYGFDPNIYNSNNISFFISTTSQYVNTNVISAVALITSGAPFYYSVLVDNTDFSNATWTAYSSSNITVNVGTNEGSHDVWIGLRGNQTNALQTWQEATLTLDTTPPVIIVTSPATGVVSQPLIQVQVSASEQLSSLTFDVSNASGVFTNQTGYITGTYFDPSLLAFTTNYFQCYEVPLASGLNSITLYATDLAGNETATNIAVTLDYSGDTTPPVVQPVWPEDGTLIGGDNFDLQARIDDTTAHVTAMIVDSSGDTNIVQGTVQVDGTVWAKSLPLAPGTNTVTLIATDAAGNTSVTNFNVNQSSVTLTIDPLPSNQLNQSSVSVTGTVSDPTENVIVNGVTAMVDADGTWSATSVPVSAVGVANIDVETYPEGSDPASTPSDGGQHSDTSQPPSILINSFELGDVYWENTHLVSGTYLTFVPGSSQYTTNFITQDCRQITTDDRDTYWVMGQDGYERIVSSSPTICADPPNQVSSSNSVPANYYSGITQGEHDEYQESGTYGNGDPYTLSSWQRESFHLETGMENADQERVYLVQAKMSDGNGALNYAWFKINGQTLMPSDNANSDGTGWGQTIITVPPGVTNLDVTPMAGNALKNFQLAEESGGSYIFQDVYYQFTMKVEDITPQMAVDNNRDGQITFDSNDATSQINPYRFWINDSLENGDDLTSSGADDQIPGQPATVFNAIAGIILPYANYNQSQIQGRNDLVNYFPVALCLSNVLPELPPTDGYEYHLVQDDSAVKFVYTSLTAANAFDYLTNTASAGYGSNFNENAIVADTIQVTGIPGAILDANWLAQVQNNGGNGVILLEGCAATSKPLWLEIWRNQRLLGGVPLYLNITGVEQMFRHLNLCAYGNGLVDPNNPSRASAPNEPPTKNENLVFLHGYNVNQQQARGVESEMFKRFYWSDSEARFYGVTWNGSVSQTYIVGVGDVTTDLQTNEVNALLTAPNLAGFLSNLSGDTVVVAHSLGNMVVLSAISAYNARIKNYFMIDSAVAIEAIDGSVSADANMINSQWNDYDTRLYASDWWQLFPTNDARSTLTWNNRLGNLRGVDVYNLYSSGEEVLREQINPTPSFFGFSASEIWQHYLGDGRPVGSYLWALQEKDKGLMSGNLILSSNHGGWRFPANSYNDPDPLPPPAANALSDSTLQQAPVFDFGSYVDISFGPFPDLTLTNTDGTGSTYAQANRDRILSDAIPALTLPAGANELSVLGTTHNLNMSSPDGINFSAFQSGWPSARSTGEEAFKWYHSDFDYVAYPFTHNLFNQIVNLGNLK